MTGGRGALKLTKYTHACVRIEHASGVLVIDPGVWSETEALTGADAILVTHEHSDHIDVSRLAGIGVPIYAPADASIAGVETIGVAPGEEFTAAGVRIRAVGGRHAFVYGGNPDCANLGYIVGIVGDALYHPGDAFHVPDQPIETLLVPAQASWLKTAEAIDFVRAVAPERAHAIHDGQINERGMGSINSWFARESCTAYRWLAPGETA